MYIGSISYYPLRCARFPQLASTRVKSHVQDIKYTRWSAFHHEFVVLQCFWKHPFSLHVATPHFMHPNLVLRLFWASVLLKIPWELPDISPKVVLFLFFVGGSVQTEQYRSGSCDLSSWCCKSGLGIVRVAVSWRLVGILTPRASNAFCKSTQNRYTY